MANTIPVWVTSPTPLPFGRTFAWGASMTNYDNGDSQGQTGWTREMLQFSVQVKNQQPGTINSLTAFVNNRKGPVLPFFFSDPYDMHVNSQLLQNTGTAVVTMELFHPVGSYHIYPNSAFIGTITSALSPALSLGTDFNLDHDSGYLTLVVSPNSDDYLTVNSTQFFRKCRFARDYSHQSPLWEIFNARLDFREIL